MEPVNTEVQADQLYNENNNFLRFTGNVQLTRGEQQLNADQVELDRISNLLTATGNLSFSDKLFRLNADSIGLDNTNNTGVFDLADFQLYENHLRGSAKKIIQLDADHRELYDVSYTTCDPQDNTWSIDAGKLKLNYLEGKGIASNAILRVKDIPVFYLPKFHFPIDNRRMSGLLTPTFVLSSSSGTQVALPYYWNQAENFDMTVTPIWYSDRGAQLNTENRYLFKNNSGQLNLSGLSDNLTNDDRWYTRWAHEIDLTDNFHTSILIQRVSDTEFLEDFDHLDTIDTVDFLQSSVVVNGLVANWSTQLLFEQYQIVNDEKTLASSPYKRLPRLSIDRVFSPNESPLTFDWMNEWVRFDKEIGVIGDRLHISPLISYPMEASYYFLNPAIQLDYTHYSLDNNIGEQHRLQRSIPLLSLDSGLFFERTANTSRNWIQTLEPRLYFLYVPYEDQSSFPDFDTSLLTENYNNLFINNRFSGVDRVGDTRQISLGITTRLFDDKNQQFFSASIGQAYYADDRKVNLNSIIDTRRKSSLMSALTFKPRADWDIQLASVYDQLEKESIQTDISVRQHTNRQVFNVEYHMRSGELEQTTFSFVYPVSANWSVFAKRQHSLIHKVPVQDLFGLAYESCCWGFKALYEESSDNNFDEVDRAFYFKLTFKGLSDTGQNIDALLEESIVGYQPVF